MHIGIVAHSDIDASFDLANAYSAIGLTITLYLPTRNVAQALNGSSSPLISIKEKKIIDPGVNIKLIDYPRMRSIQSFSVVNRINQMMLKDKIDIVHILAGPGEIWLSVLACVIRKIPVVSTMIIPNPNIGDEMPSLVGKLTNRILCWGSKLIIVNGKNQIDWVANTYKIKVSRLRYIPLCPRVTSTKWIQRPIPEKQGLILFFGRAAVHKGLEYLIKAEKLITNEVSSARFLLACHGEDLQRCLSFIQDQDRYEIHEGFISGELMAEYYQRAAIVVLPYLSASTSGVLLTAYEFGKPVVATNVGSLPEYVVNGKTGLLIEQKDEKQLAESVVTLLNDQARLHQLGVNAKNWVDNLKQEVINKNIDLYESVLAHPN
jgi:alpha-maltose-1-phosphate synthase